MASPIHKYLFSPPPSPPHRATDDSLDPTQAHGLTSLKSLILPTDLIPRSSLDGRDSNSKPQSPRTPQQRRFTFEKTSNSPLYSKPTVTVLDVESTPRTPRILSFDDTSSTNTPISKMSDRIYIPNNVPTTSMQVSFSIPRPLVRLFCLLALVASSLVLLVYVPATRLPSLSIASTSRRLALAPDGRAYYDVTNGVASIDEAMDRDYQPANIRISNMKRRSFTELERVSVAPPTVSRPHSKQRPVPHSHELLAVQSYLLQSTYNLLPLDGDIASPVNAESILGFSAHKLGPSGGDAEKAWLAELEQERHDDIIVWYGGNGDDAPPHALLDILAALHGPKRKPHLISIKNRKDAHIIHAVLERQSLSIRHNPLIMMGNVPIVGDLDGLDELRGSGKLREMMSHIGWLKPESKRAVRPIKVAKLKKRELTELEHALKLA